MKPGVVPDYDTLMPSFCPPYNRALAEFATRAKTASTVFEAGTGTGNIAKAILLENPSARYTGVDVDEKSLDVARKKLAGYNSEMSVGDFKTVPIPSSDLIVSSLSIHHLSHDEQAALLKRIYGLNRRFLHFELIAPEDEEEKQAVTQLLHDHFRKQGEKFGIPLETILALEAQSAKHDNPMKLSDHVRIQRELGVQVDIVFKEYCFAFYEGRLGH